MRAGSAIRDSDERAGVHDPANIDLVIDASGVHATGTELIELGPAVALAP